MLATRAQGKILCKGAELPLLSRFPDFCFSPLLGPLVILSKVDRITTHLVLSNSFILLISGLFLPRCGSNSALCSITVIVAGQTGAELKSIGSIGFITRSIAIGNLL